MTDPVVLAAREYTTDELSFHAEAARRSGMFHLEALYLDALAVHARATSWGDLIVESMFRKEE